MIPTEQDQTRARRDVRRLVRQADAQPRGKGRDRKMARLVYLVAELVFIERVRAMDDLERAALRPVDVERLRDDVKVRDVQARLALMRSGAGIEVAR